MIRMKKSVSWLMFAVMLFCLIGLVEYSVHSEIVYGSIRPGEDETDIILKPTATPEPTETPTVTPTTIPTETPATTPTETPATTPTISPGETPIVNAIEHGNVNADDSIDARDALDVLKHAAKLTSLDEDKLLLADVTGDGKVDARDALDILKYAAKIIDEFLCVAQ